MASDRQSKGSKNSKTSSTKQPVSPKLSPPHLPRTAGSKGKDPYRDPIKEARFEEEMTKAIEQYALQELTKAKKTKVVRVQPDIPIRLGVSEPPDLEFPRPPYVYTKSEKLQKQQEQQRQMLEKRRQFCKWDTSDMPYPVDVATIGGVVSEQSPEVSATKVNVLPKKPSALGTDIPEAPNEAELSLKKPKSGIFINETSPPVMQSTKDSFDLVFERKPRPKRPEDIEAEEKETKLKQKQKEQQLGTVDYTAGEKETGDDAKRKSAIDAIIEESELEKGEGEEGDLVQESMITKMLRRKVSQVSKATSLNSKELTEFPVFSEEDLAGQPYMTRIIQKFRRDSEAERYRPPKRKILRGTLESHSFTKLDQPILKEFYFGIVLASINQNDTHFGESSRNLQGLCMPVAAYCFSMIMHPNKWTELVMDDILELGDRLYIDSVGHIHLHEQKKELDYNELHKYCFIDDKKIRFQICEPEIVGLISSGDKKIYNLYKGLKLFFHRHRACILRATGINIVIWKDEHYYFFDSKGRRKDLSPDYEKGKAVLANMYDIADICTVLLKYENIGTLPFTLHKLTVSKIMDKDAPEEALQQELQDRSDYNILDENRAVIQGSFDLADMCFDFSRNKQAIAMAAVCLVYSRITPPSAWHKKTLDKIMIIGNQLYLELVASENILEMALENLPAAFTVGPYAVEITIYSNVYADCMYRKNTCMFEKDLEKFFETNTMGIVCVGKFTLAIWKQRNMYYCFDPYSRNHEGLKCRNGNACISMNCKLDTLVQTVVTNFDTKDDIFYMHALKVLKVNRDPAQEALFPKTSTMDDISPETLKTYKMKKSRKKAIDKTVTANFGESAVKKLLPWDFLAPSVIEIGSAVESLTPDQMPSMKTKFPSRAMLRATLPESCKAIDLDSPSLSDTQIDPERPAPVKDDQEMDMSAWELTQEELELEGAAEGAEGEEEGEDESPDTYLAMDQYAQVHADSLDSYHRKLSAQVNTDITVGFLPVPREILPATNMRWKQKLLKERELARKREVLVADGALVESPVTQSKELAKPSNFVNLPDNTQVIRGTVNIASIGGDEMDYMAPFVCMMASAVAKKYDVTTWSSEIIDYTLRSGSQLYKLSKVRYDQVPILDVPKISLGRSNYSILVEYLLDTVMKQYILEEALEKGLFKKYDCGLVVTPSYACAVFVKNNLYYMFDCFGCNEVGLSEGHRDLGAACFSRFKNLHDMTTRIMHNKAKCDNIAEFEFTRFVLSSCTAKLIPEPPISVRSKKGKMDKGEDGGEDQAAVEAPKPKTENKVGYQLNDGVLTLQGSTSLKGRDTVKENELKEDHFVCICACLMLLNYPVLKWDTRRVDYVIEQGLNIYQHAENFDYANKRIIRNILIYKHFFDIIITSIEITNWKYRKNIGLAMDYVLAKRDYVLLQYPNCCFVIYKHNNFYHLFDPYPCTNTGMIDNSDDGRGGWIMFQGIDALKNRLKEQSAEPNFIFYTFDVTSVRKAPKKIIMSQRFLDYELVEKVKPEEIGRAFDEKETWLLKDPIPWSRIKATTAKDRIRGKKENMWHNWDVEYPKDLYSLVGTLHQTSSEFEERARGKQTLANLVVAFGMLEIYELSEWNSSVIDSVLTNGNAYFLKCIAEIEIEDYELTLDDIKEECTIFPYKFEVFLSPIVDGTMFLTRPKQFNLYKALRLFFDNYECRNGIICVNKGERIQKRFIAFGKVRECEYFMFDCQALGSPMFIDNRGAAYMLRCRSLRRLVHVLVLTLRGGDFFIFDVEVYNFAPLG